MSSPIDCIVWVGSVGAIVTGHFYTTLQAIHKFFVAYLVKDIANFLVTLVIVGAT